MTCKKCGGVMLDMKHNLDDIRDYYYTHKEEYHNPFRAEAELKNIEFVTCPECGSGDISYTSEKLGACKGDIKKVEEWKKEMEKLVSEQEQTKQLEVKK